ncbi:hypothetical protein ONS96_008732 [Cadophora gregata f. sp. sojae]|nr:hypothetical protein ONS96_008732 [Cadophora gregata f. sp. sojae]
MDTDMYPHEVNQILPSNFSDLEVDDFGDESYQKTCRNQLSNERLPKRAQNYTMMHYIIAICCFTTSLGIFVFTMLSDRHHIEYVSTKSELETGAFLNVNRDVLRSPCGSSPAEAKALGCTFDIISFCWLPNRCYDAELSQRLDKLSNWEWFLDHNKTQPVAKSDALTGELDGLYVSWEYHVQHCVFMWEKMHRAFLGGGKRAVDGYIGVFSHTQHCGKMLLTRGEGFELSDFNTRIKVKYPDCGIE